MAIAPPIVMYRFSSACDSHGGSGMVVPDGLGAPERPQEVQVEGRFERQTLHNQLISARRREAVAAATRSRMDFSLSADGCSITRRILAPCPSMDGLIHQHRQRHSFHRAFRHLGAPYNTA